MSTSRIPPLLAPFVAPPPPSSLILLTSILGASTNWLVLRFIYTAFTTHPAPTSLPLEEGGDFVVVLASFLRDSTFWVDNARKLGVDLIKEGKAGRWRFLDFLTRERGVKAVKEEVETAVKEVAKGRRVLLVWDGVDFLSAVTEGGGVQEMVWGLQEHVYSTIITISADESLVHHPSTSLEIAHTALLMGLAHRAAYTVSLRLLDTGVARDVSGVMRVTLGAQEEEAGRNGLEERELLYFVAGDGGIRVFERGQ